MRIGTNRRTCRGISALAAGAASFALVTALPAGARARGRALEAVTLAGSKVRVDGLLREWPAELDALSETIQGSAAGGDPKATGAIGYDEKNIYVAMKIKDSKLVRTASFGDREDYGSLEIAFPSERGFKAHSVRFYAGVIGKSAGTVKLDGSTVKGARIVEAPSEGGYSIEASVPWDVFPEASRGRAGLRGALRYVDVDGGSVHAIVATGGGSGSSLGPILLEAEQGLYRNLVKAKNLHETPARFGVGDIAGDSTLEIVALYGPFLTVVGSSYRGGKEFLYQDVGGIKDASDVTWFDVEDVTGDGKAEILLEKRVGTKDEYREVLQILRVADGDTPYVAFQHETGIVTKTGTIKNEVSVKRKGSRPNVVISQGKAEGFDPETYAEPLSGDMDPALFPWDKMKSKAFEWDGKQFAPAGTESWQPTMKAPGAAPKRAAKTADEGPPAPPPPRPPSADELLDRVYALYRQERKTGIEKPRFDFVTDVAGDSSPERVLVHGKDVVVFGKKFKEGTSYVYTSVGVESSKDISDVTARDLTGDGKAEVIVRCVLHAKASKQLGGDVVDRHALFVYQVYETALRRVFAAETGRSVGDNAITEGVRFVPKGRATALELAPGRAIGWTEKTYPFPVDKSPYGGLEPLLVPWGDVSVKRYHYDGNVYTAD
jgi:hypothetical protein